MKTRLLDLFLSIGLATVSVSADPAPKLPGCPSAEAIEREAVRAVETARSKPRNCGKSHFAAAKPLRWNPVLFKAANQHAEDMSRKGYFDHNSPDGCSPGDRLSAAGYSWQTYGENIALGQPTVAEVVEGWLGSPEHCGKSHFAAAKPLRWNPALFKAAHQHAEDMSRKGYFDHNSPNGRSPGDRLSAAGYSWQTYGENIALGQPTVAEVVEGWLGSPEHCGNIMNGEFTEVGVACAASGSPEKANPPYWVMVLAAPLSKSGR
jgi:uncharacterized protein YkwD